MLHFFLGGGNLKQKNVRKNTIFSDLTTGEIVSDGQLREVIIPVIPLDDCEYVISRVDNFFLDVFSYLC